MSVSLKNSEFLEYVINKAEELKKDKGYKILSVNHIFAAVLKYLIEKPNQDDVKEFDKNELLQVTTLMSGITGEGEAAVLKFVDLLCEKNVGFMDDFVYRNVMDSSRRIADKDNNDTLSAVTVLKYIINEPTEEIKLILNASGRTEENNVEDEIKPVDISAIFGGTKSDEADEEDKPLDFIALAEELEKKNDIPPKEKIAKLTEKAKLMQKKLSSVVFGQDNAISIFTTGYFESEFREITDKDSRKPKATYLFAGPPGVGKTFLAEQVAEMLERPFKRFDMSEYIEHDSVMELCGTNGSYKDAKPGELTNFVHKNPECVLLFDEIEKANITIIHLFLQILDAGRLRDTNTRKVVDFSKTIIIFTTNAGRKIYEGSLTSNLSGISRKTILKALETDVDPKTGRSVFPAAICSRFATGKVVMFNHMEAHSLRKIAEKEILRNASCFENETGIKCNVDDDVYSCVLFSEGGHADARTVKSRAGAFFSSELYELFRLVSNEENDKNIEKIESIDITIDLPEDEQVKRLFRDNSKGSVLTFADKRYCGKLSTVITEKGYNHIIITSLEEAKIIIEKQDDIKIIFCDLHTGKKASADELNIEDVLSKGREFFRYVCEKSEAPLYIVSSGKHQYSEEEKFSLIKEGARDVVSIDDAVQVSEIVDDILVQIHQQQSMIDLAKSSKLVAFETSQVLSDNGKKAEIKVFDLSLETSVDAEDSGDILSDVSKPNIKFEDVIGADSAKDELKYFVEYLKNPKAFAAKGLGVPKGVLFYGPPGTGKTMLAKAVAGESDVTFICAEGNQFLKKFVGEGEEAVHKLFATARKYAPTIVFIDEIDAIAKERKGEAASADSILTAFLAEMDGFKTDAKRPIFVLAATNFDVQPGTSKSLDAALLRRFDRHIFIDLPDKKARIKYMKKRIADKPVFDISEEEIENIAIRSTGMSLARLASVFEFSMRIAIRNNKNLVDNETLEEAFETFVYGEEKKWDESELKKTAYHEAGHAFLSWYCGETPSYLTIVARGNHGGYMLHGDNENRGSYTKEQLLDRIKTALGGRAAELVFFGEAEGMSTGASGDLRTATAIAKSMVCDYGMDEEIGLATIQEKELSDGLLAQQIRNVVNKILIQELNLVKKILDKNRVAIDKIVELLLQENHLSTNEIEGVFLKFASKREEIK